MAVVTARAGPNAGGLADADLLIEAVFEDLALKARSSCRGSRPKVRPDALVATNTSCLRVSGLAAP